MRRIKTSGNATKDSEFDILLLSVNSFILPILKSLFGVFFLLSACLGKMAFQMKFLEEMN